MFSLLFITVVSAVTANAQATTAKRLDLVENATKHEGPNCMSTTLFLAGVQDHVANLGQPYFLATFIEGGFSGACKELETGGNFQAGDILILQGKQTTGEREIRKYPHVAIFIDEKNVVSKEDQEKGSKIWGAPALEVARFFGNCLPGVEDSACKYRAIVSRCEHGRIRRQHDAWAAAKKLDQDFAIVDEFFRTYYFEGKREGLRSAESALRRLEKKKLYSGVMYNRFINDSILDLFDPRIPRAKVGEFLLFLRVEGSREGLEFIKREVGRPARP
jgi:hypothetical protein